VAKPIEGLTAGRQLLIDIRSFQLSLAAAPQAEVEFSAKILGDNGQIVDARIFRATVPTTAADASAAAGALDSAFGRVATELVVWASGLI
ncbi:MAG: ABC-type transport auxiliary lipoprotein family protein, partial [Pseudolabrys sp.]